jgi:very-short-patch-repair endonuclease
MTNIVSELEKKNLENITKKRKYPIKVVDGKKIWYKFCPNCNREQQYSTLRAVSTATKKNRQCLFCKNKGSGNPFFGKHHSEEHRQNLSKKQLNSCSYRYKRIGKNPDKIKKECKFCNRVFYVSKCQNRRKYHSYECAINDNFGFDPLIKTKPEKEFEDWLKVKNINYTSQFQLKGKLYDFYIPSKNLLVEIDGIYWHGKNIPIKKLNETQRCNRINDKIKTCIAKENGYNLLRIWEDEIKNVSKYLYIQER